MCDKQQASRLKLEKWRGHRSRIEIHRMMPEFLLCSHTSSVAQYHPSTSWQFYAHGIKLQLYKHTYHEAIPFGVAFVFPWISNSLNFQPRYNCTFLLLESMCESNYILLLIYQPIKNQVNSYISVLFCDWFTGTLELIFAKMELQFISRHLTWLLGDLYFTNSKN